MLIERKEDLSVYYWLVGQFSDTPFVKVVDEFPLDNLEIPTISVDVDIVDVLPLELGNQIGFNFRIWSIDVFALNTAQRKEFAYRILNEIQKGIPVYNYDEGFPPSVTPTQIGKLEVRNLRMENIAVNPEFVDQLYYRSQITFTAVNNKVI